MTLLLILKGICNFGAIVTWELAVSCEKQNHCSCYSTVDEGFNCWGCWVTWYSFWQSKNSSLIKDYIEFQVFSYRCFPWRVNCPVVCEDRMWCVWLSSEPFNFMIFLCFYSCKPFYRLYWWFQKGNMNWLSGELTRKSHPKWRFTENELLSLHLWKTKT